MARPKPLPADVEIDPATKKVRCKICKDGDPLGLGTWINKKSLDKHLESDAHKTELLRKIERDEQAAAQKARLQDTYSSGSTRIHFDGLNTLDDIQQSQAGMFDPMPDADDAVFNQYMADRAPPLIPTYIEPITHDPATERERLRRQFEELMLQAEHEDEFGTGPTEDDITVTNVVNDFRSLELESIHDEDEIQAQFNRVPVTSDYAPYPNKTSMLLDIIDNLPRLRMSGSQLRMILWLLKESGVRDVPSCDAFRKMQTSLRDLCGSIPKHYTSSIGNHFYTNDIRESIARDFSNPEIAKHLHLYPEETTGPISEVWQAERWKEFKPSELTPMFSRGLRQFYIDELAQLIDGQFVIPRDWVIRNGELTAKCSEISQSPAGWRIEDTLQVVPVSQFQYNYYDIIGRVGGDIAWRDGTPAPRMPNALRQLANDEDLFVVMVPLWCDDVSGNKSKQYNKHINIYMANSNIPGRLLQQEYFVRFVSTSPHATSPEQFSALKEQVSATQKEPIHCYNSDTKRSCRVILRVPALPADNPQQSEEASHMGGNANCGCRKCKAGGPHEHTESDEGYHSLFFAGIARSADETRQQLERQIDLAMYGVEKPVQEMQTATGTKDKVAQYWIEILLKKAREMKSEQPGRSAESVADELREWLKEQPGDKINPLLSIAGLDPTQDTPVEILHTILLGIIKYVWYLLHTSWSDSDRELFSIRLQSTDIDGLNVPPIRGAYMMQYRNNLIGKHFKTLMQTMAFHVHDLVTPSQFALVKAVGALGAVLWVHEIDDMDRYLEDLSVLVGNVLDAFADVDPAKIIIKIKLHLLPHLMEDVRRFGPAIRNSTEVFECFNAIFRLCSVLSNHQAPSRDIASKFASMDRVKHMLSGGYWMQDGQWVQAGESVRQVLHSEPVVQRHLGWVPPRSTIPGPYNVLEPLAIDINVFPGTVRLQGRKKIPPCEWHETLASKSFRPDTDIVFPALMSWRQGHSVIAQSGDYCYKGSWIFARVHPEEPLLIGRICEMVVPDVGLKSAALVSLDRFILGDRLHPDFDLPVLQQPGANEQQQVTVYAKSILFVFSAQHDCRLVKCQPTALQPQLQERQLTSRSNQLIAHGDDAHYVLNLYALHNAELLRRTLPRQLSVPRPIYDDRKAHHREIAAKLRVSQATKRSTTQAKRKATLAAKKAKKLAESHDSDGHQESEHDGDFNEEAEPEEHPAKRKRRK
ncbi:hypothetical protein FPV67DRAFT_1732296 [Lyophyllum atratum]|nr:hypothetical protein FPV67DRAFT_1732296 [Lyophyllum atratum]